MAQVLEAFAKRFLNDPLSATIESMPPSSHEFESGRQTGHNGRLLINAAGTIWLVDNGYARGYVREELFTRIHYWRITRRECYLGTGCSDVTRPVNLYRIVNHPSELGIEEHAPYSDNIRLIRNPETGETFHYENNLKRWIPGMNVFHLYQFDWDDVQNYTPAVINGIPRGDDIQART